MELDGYFEATRPAVEHMFAALQQYDAVTPAPSLAFHADDHGVVRFSAATAGDYMERLSHSLALEFAKATLCGSIAQVAYMALRQYSGNTDVVADCLGFGVVPGSPTARFCVGRRVHGIPLGLLIYAARVQYNHWDEGTPSNPVPRAVFDALMRHYYNDVSFDLAYALDWPSPRPVAHYIVRHELRWLAYETYLVDLKDALSTR